MLFKKKTKNSRAVENSVSPVTGVSTERRKTSVIIFGGLQSRGCVSLGGLQAERVGRGWKEKPGLLVLPGTRPEAYLPCPWHTPSVSSQKPITALLQSPWVHALPNSPASVGKLELKTRNPEAG